MRKKICMRFITSVFVCALVLSAALFNVNVEVSAMDNSSTESLTNVKGLQLPVNGGYYRSWHDKAHDPSRPNSMLDVPEEVNLVFVFPGGEETPEFWRALKEDYVPAMNARGQKVVRTINLGMVLKGDKTGDVIDYDLDESTYAKRAQQIYDVYVAEHNVDGLDIDYEKHHTLSADGRELLSEKNIDDATGIIKELKKILDANNKLFILDTTMKATQLDRFNYERVNKLFPRISDCFDFVLMQAYGQNEAEFNEFWETYKPYIRPEQYLIGFSWYEENSPKGNQWFDVPGFGEEFSNSRAVQEHVKWQPDNGVKAGVFSYAIERDGVAHGDNNIVKSDFSNSVKLKELMEKSGDYTLLTEEHIPDKHLLEEIKSKVGPYLRTFRLFDGDLEISNPEIESLQGLELMQNVKSLNLNGLSKVKEINKGLLPRNIANVIPETKNEKVFSKLKLSGLNSLEKLDLSGLNLETLEFSGVEEWSLLREFNLSNNLLDFYEGSKNREILDTLIENVKNNTSAGDVSSLTLFDNQKPRSFFNSAILDKNVEVEKNSEANDVFKYIKSQETSTGRVVKDENEFNSFKEESINGTKFVANDYTFEEFKYDVSNYNARIITHDNQIFSDTRDSGSSVINNQEEETYRVVYFDEHNKVAHELKYVVGTEKEIMVDLAENVKVLGTSSMMRDYKELVPNLFDNKLNGYGDGIFTYDARNIEEKPFWIAFDLGEGAKVQKLEIWNATKADAYMLKDMNAKAGELYVLKESNPDTANLSNSEYLENDDNWEKVFSFSDSNQLNEITNIFGQAYENNIWKLKITEVAGTGYYRSLALSEIRLLGQRDNTVDKSALEELIQTAKAELEDIKWTDETKTELLAVVEEAEMIFADEEANKGQVRNIQDKLQKAIDALVEKPLADKDKLNYLVAMLDTIDLSDKTEESIENLKAAELKAKEILAENYASQEEVDQAEKALQEAINSLVEKSATDENEVSKADLQKAIAVAEAVELENVEEDENLNEFRNKLAEAKMLNELDGLTQEQVEQAAKELNEAVKGLKFKEVTPDPEMPGEQEPGENPGEEEPENPSKEPGEQEPEAPQEPQEPQVPQDPETEQPEDNESNSASLRIDPNSPFKDINIISDEGKHTGYTLWAEKLESSDKDKKEVFEIKLLDANGNAVQPKAKLGLEITIGFDLEKDEILSLTHIKSDGTSENLDVKINGRQVVFETDGFSKFIFAAEKLESENTTASSSMATEATSKSESKSTPAKTGATTYYIPLALIALSLASVVIVVRRKLED